MLCKPSHTHARMVHGNRCSAHIVLDDHLVTRSRRAPEEGSETLAGVLLRGGGEQLRVGLVDGLGFGAPEEVQRPSASSALRMWYCATSDLSRATSLQLEFPCPRLALRNTRPDGALRGGVSLSAANWARRHRRGRRATAPPPTRPPPPASPTPPARPSIWPLHHLSSTRPTRPTSTRRRSVASCAPASSRKTSRRRRSSTSATPSPRPRHAPTPA